VRSLIEQVRIIPADGQVTIELKGELAGRLVLAEKLAELAACCELVIGPNKVPFDS
jgi:hypothetical protein